MLLKSLNVLSLDPDLKRPRKLELLGSCSRLTVAVRTSMRLLRRDLSFLLWDELSVEDYTHRTSTGDLAIIGASSHESVGNVPSGNHVGFCDPVKQEWHRAEAAKFFPDIGSDYQIATS